ncbi:hypothetical protein ScPMuIL_016090 [Solemya velum]
MYFGYFIEDVYRAGLTNPKDVYPNDNNTEDTWPEGFNWLSQGGVKQRYELGEYLHREYINYTHLLNPAYDHKQIQVKSSAEKSASSDECVEVRWLAFFLTTTKRHGPKFIVAANSRRSSTSEGDNMLSQQKDCPTYDKLVKKIDEHQENQRNRKGNEVYRAGLTNPKDVYPNDNNTEDTWPEGFNWLSQEGVKQRYELGEYLHREYINYTHLLNPAYDHKQIQVKSSAEKSALMSAYSTLAGIFPYDNETTRTPNLLWQQIPVEAVPVKEDNMLSQQKDCPTYDKLVKKSMNTKKIKEIEKENEECFKFIANETGYEHVDLRTVWDLYDILLTEQLANRSLPSWCTLGKAEQTGKKSTNRRTTFKRDNPQYEGSRKGYFQCHQDVHVFYPRIHSEIIVRSSWYKAPKHIHTVRCERGTDAGVVRGKKRTLLCQNFNLNGTFNLPECPTNCILEEFIELTKNRVPLDWNNECGLKNNDDHNSSSADTLTIGILGLLLAISLIVILVMLYKWRKRDELARLINEAE